MTITWKKSPTKSFFRKGVDEKGNLYYHIPKSDRIKEQYICIILHTANLGYGNTAEEALRWAEAKERRNNPFDGRWNVL